MFFRILIIVTLAMCGALRAAEITAIPLQERDGAIFIDGDLQYQDREIFLTKIAPFSGGLVVLSSNGGSAYAGIEIGRAIRMHGFKTWVPSGKICASACAIAWLGGTERLVGKAAVIGFHSVYKIESGAPIETGVGNAKYGAYLGQLGLSDRAITYLSEAAPTSMNWLTPSDAETIGISLRVFDPKPTSPSAAPRGDPPMASPGASSPAAPPNLEVRARDFVVALNVLLSGPSEQYIKLLDGIYAEQVVYFGKQLPRSDVVIQLTKFIDRWPIRSYAVRPESLKTQCSNETSACQISGLIEFSAKSPARNQWSHGVASFDYLLSFRPNAKWPVIVNEAGAVVSRQMDAMQSTVDAPFAQNFGIGR